MPSPPDEQHLELVCKTGGAAPKEDDVGGQRGSRLVFLPIRGQKLGLGQAVLVDKPHGFSSLPVNARDRAAACSALAAICSQGLLGTVLHRIERHVSAQRCFHGKVLGIPAP